MSKSLLWVIVGTVLILVFLSNIVNALERNDRCVKEAISALPNASVESLYKFPYVIVEMDNGDLEIYKCLETLTND